MKYALVKFLSSRDESNAENFIYQNPVNADKYDAVIVPTRYGLSLAVVTATGNEIATLVEKSSRFHYADGSTIKSIAEIIQSETVAAEMVVEKRKDMKKQLEAKVKKLDDIARFELYASQDPEFAALLKDYKAIQ